MKQSSLLSPPKVFQWVYSLLRMEIRFIKQRSLRGPALLGMIVVVQLIIVEKRIS